MLLNRLTRYPPIGRLANCASIRMASTIVGASGRSYVQGGVLRRHPEDEKLSVFEAQCVSDSLYISSLHAAML